MSWEGSSAPEWDAERLRVATDAAGIALWSWNVDTDEIALDERARALWGVSRDGPVTFGELSQRIHPADLERVRQAFQATRVRTGAYEIDFRIRHSGAVHWISARGQGSDVGIVGRVMFGVFLDVTARKQADEVRDLAASEMSHRVKNLFSVASALTAISARSAETATEMAQDLIRRLGLLRRAHDLVRPTWSQIEEQAAPLTDMLATLLEPYGSSVPSGSRIGVSVPDVRVGSTAATTLVLIVHELATNSIKYGALSQEGGTLDVRCTEHDDEVVVVWTEQGGPSVTAPAGTMGYGSKLVARSISGQLGGAITFDWPASGMVATMRMSKARLAV